MNIVFVIVVASTFLVYHFKGASSDCFRLFFKLSEILVSEESSYFSHYPLWILQLKNVPLEDINENVTSYGNRQSKIYNLSLHPNGLSDLTEIWNQDFFGDDALFEGLYPFWEIGPGTFNAARSFWPV